MKKRSDGGKRIDMVKDEEEEEEGEGNKSGREEEGEKRSNETQDSTVF